MMDYIISSRDLIELRTTWRTNLSHIVILGAGASLAAFPCGDAHGRKLPLMTNATKVLGLESLARESGHDPEQSFESLYSTLHQLDPNSPLVRRIEQRVEDYFSNMELPDAPGLYDSLLLSLRAKDAIFTFNWDPFLADTAARYAGIVPLPKIFHLHGNVRVSYCANCGMSQLRNEACAMCGGKSDPTRLLYPVERKDYASDGFISTQWKAFRRFIYNAAYVTIFGYSAPRTDQEAVHFFFAGMERKGA